jgi:hypothetical protein
MFPLFEIVTLFELELPTPTEAKLTLAGLPEIVTLPATPDPLKLTVVGELGALLVMLTVPESDPAVVGANNALNVVL